ncbi:hypothetical protein FQA47_011599 [Oryzias melastigma]|uniref:Uncharacterized protein n=1 Tax=Oryzias melastigma TaxID=30732 RepID=A0A834CLG8_ORYME|nr:hypothetical protein FQA47_011599 [Oryzias melastigma]
MAPLLCHLDKQLSAMDIEHLFKPDLSEAGSNKRNQEEKTISFWADYLLDCEVSHGKHVCQHFKAPSRGQLQHI